MANSLINSVVLPTDEPLVELIVPDKNNPNSTGLPHQKDNSNINRKDFPDTFVFGSGTGAYQVEGAAAVGGKGLSVWDEFTLRTPGRITDGSNGNVACGMYHRYKEDIRSMKNMGFDAYRFSISWPRILPGGRACMGINREGIDYYNDVIDTVIKNGMKPYVTLFHWDLPACLEKEYDGFLSKKVVEDFSAYAELCFWEFGDRVKWWTTINEPWTYSVNGYVIGAFPPGKASSPPQQARKNLPAHRSTVNLPKDKDQIVLVSRDSSGATFDKMDPAKDAYTVTRNLLLAHSVAVDSYRTKFKDVQQGVIGIVLNSNWHVAYDESSPDDIAARDRAVDFMLGWFLEPVLRGEYPKSMIEYVPADNLAYFSPSEKEMLKGSVDYVGLNYYTTSYVQYDPNPEGVGYDADQKLKFPDLKDGKPIGDPCGSSWLYIYPVGIYEHLVYITKTYPEIPPMYITENGVSDKNDFNLTAKEACVDPIRIKYHQDHLAFIKKAMDECKPRLQVKGYFVWSWCDNFEWTEGYTVRFGINYVDYMNDQTRYPKNSALWFTKFLKGPKKLLATSRKRQIEDDAENGTVQKRIRDGEE